MTVFTPMSASLCVDAAISVYCPRYLGLTGTLA
jgi:hypothetical protein